MGPDPGCQKGKTGVPLDNFEQEQFVLGGYVKVRKRGIKTYHST